MSMEETRYKNTRELVSMDTTEKEKTAVAVAYEPGERAPKIIATGKGYMAERIIEKAKEEKIPFYRDNKLAEVGDWRDDSTGIVRGDCRDFGICG